MTYIDQLSIKDIRQANWWEEISEYFGISAELLQTAVAFKRLDPHEESRELISAREQIRQQFMSQKSIKLHDRILYEHVEDVSDFERSSSWKDYIFVCINGERRCFQNMRFYDWIIHSIVKPRLQHTDSLKIMDYGCGSSLFTRLLSQDFPHKVTTISADVSKPAVEFSVARNSRYNLNGSQGVLIEDVMSFPDVSGIDLTLANTVFEHLPNSAYQIEQLVKSLSKSGVLVENYVGHSQATPHKSDTFDSYKSRDRNLDMLRDQLTLVYGSLPEKRDGIYMESSKTRVWVSDETPEIISRMRKRLKFYQYHRKFLRLMDKAGYYRRGKV